jgi:hypothetical protein
LKRALWVLLCLSLMVACEESKTEILQRRLDNFRNMTPCCRMTLSSENNSRT